ncbi:E3 ubiquitin-protein ligase TRIM38-like isoform X2 [Gouania willdenowi]|uniref:E3 ubiquitin-protein ligase TRIM38-like isoform X2 n=1 Tax=Gouania willdenowi TaxID=441366 RepID=UPI001055699F|nr:E3 ubiquitin-protein ligase TRIM38-like isoform X2 [Gouania willdenowi]
MASDPKLPDLLVSLMDKLTCSVCTQLFTDPVTITCGHSFCKTCLEDQSGNQCPKCQAPVERVPEVNVVLCEMIQQVNGQGGNESQGASGEVQCDVCTLKAEKSCLVCLSSYCSVHIRKHLHNRRLQRHELKDLDQRACQKHGRPLVFYNTNQQVFMCVHCVSISEDIVFIEEEAKKKKTQINEVLAKWKNEITHRENKREEFSNDLHSCKEELNGEIQEIKKVFNNMMTVVKKTMNKVLQPMLEKKRSLEQETKTLQYNLGTEVDQIHQTISELENISNIEDSVIFLLTYSSSQVKPNLTDWTNIKLDTDLLFGSMRTATTQMMENIKLEVEKLTPIEIRRVSKFPVDVKLDPTTAHRHLKVSKDCKTVKYGRKNQKVEKSPQRFDKFGSVLGDKGIKSGKSYLEVEVSNKTGWELGVARVDANRQGNLNLNPESGYWVVAHYDDKKFSALKAPPLRLLLSEKPEKVGMFVDYEEGLVSFYNVGAASHIYSFTEGSFSGEILPYFSPHAKKDEANSESLTISPLKPRKYGRNLFFLFSSLTVLAILLFFFSSLTVF